jgi:hypothetical protein
MNTIPRISVILAAATALLAVSQADAAGIRVRCEKRADRSVISVDGKKLDAGSYAAVVRSGSNQKTSNAPLVPAVGGQAEFDFSSQLADQNTGATPIGVAFIQGGVIGQIVDSTGFVVAESTVSCRIR